MRISLIRTRLVDLDNEAAAPEDGYALILRKDYGPGVVWNEDLSVTRLTRDQVCGPTPVELLRYMFEVSTELSDAIQFAAENAEGIYVGDVLVEPPELKEILNPGPRP